VVLAAYNGPFWPARLMTLAEREQFEASHGQLATAKVRHHHRHRRHPTGRTG
jgi:hypothetical protein